MLRTLAAACLALAAVTHPAAATTCPLVTDATGDAQLPYDAGLDIVSADIASDGTDLAAVIRLAALPAQQPPPFRRAYYSMYFTVDGWRIEYRGWIGPDGTSTLFYAEVWDGGPITQRIPGFIDGSVDLATGEITMRAPLDLLDDYVPIAAGDVASDLHANSKRELDAAETVAYLHTADQASTTQTYEVDSPGCITV
jgi:hypothetical protein